MSPHCRPVNSCARVRTASQDDLRPVWLGLQFRKQCAKLFRRQHVWVCLAVGAFRPCSLAGIIFVQLPSGRPLQPHLEEAAREYSKGSRLDYSGKQEMCVLVCAALTRARRTETSSGVISRRERHLLIRFALVMRTHLDRHFSAKAPEEIEELICREAAEMSIH